MSLSGLDSPAVEAAARTVSLEKGAWYVSEILQTNGPLFYLLFKPVLTLRGARFLVHYVSRDEVDVLSQGTKGVAELREAAEKYYNGSAEAEAETKTGPLFGMIDFRRRKVLIKLVPDDTTRLIKGMVQERRSDLACGLMV
jgi:hypothetical protein